jgi:hypothetical protein
MPTDQLSDTFAALADPTRRAILARLAEGDATVNELAAPSGLIARGRAAQSRPSSLRVEALEQATEWMETRRVTWERRMDRLDRHLEEIQKGPKR